MIVYVNQNNEIKDVGATLDSTLTPLEITDGTFDGWSIHSMPIWRTTTLITSMLWRVH